MPYLLKTEPDTYSFDDLLRDGETTWDGISNPQALLNLRSMKPDDRLIIYHSGKAKSPSARLKSSLSMTPHPRNPKVRIKAGKPVKQPHTLAEMRDAPVFKTRSSSVNFAFR